jgi:formylglycine-generating enzyme required for sulfatase activity
VRIFAKIRSLGPACTSKAGILAAAAFLLLASATAAEEKERLSKHFGPLYKAFGQNSTTKVTILSGPEAVKMRNGQVPGKRWMATAGNYAFALTIQDKAGYTLEKLVGIIEKLPPIYMAACAAVSDEGEDGIAVYTSLGGAAAHGGQGYINIVPTANALVIAHEAGHTLEQVARSKDTSILEQWAAAIKADKVSISAYGDSVCHEDVGEFARLYAVCLDAGQGPLAELRRLSPRRFALWTLMLCSQPPALGKTPDLAKVSQAQIAEANRLGVPVTFTNSVGMTFVLVPAGTFMMGSGDSAKEVARRCNMPHAQLAWFHDEGPRHEVTLTAFYMSIHEVTQGQYATLAKPIADPRNVNGEIAACPAAFLGVTKPAVCVGWNDSAAFLDTLNQRESEQRRTYILPTEAQWEYACRAGSTTPFSFGETLSADQANYDGDYTYADGKQGERRGATVPVGSLPANAWGLHEMHGNVSEWCRDWYAEYAGGPETDPHGLDKGPRNGERVIRGGAWRSYPGACRSSCRLKASDHRFRKSHIGFRVSCPLPPNKGGQN